MTTSPRAKPGFAACSAILLASACASTTSSDTSTDAGSTPRAGIPVATDENIDTQWAYLLDRYDENGDGSVSSAEYSREGGSIDRWDRDEDGQLTDADFASSSSGMGSGPSPADMRRQMREPMGRRMMSRYFQRDDDNTQVTRVEFQQSIADYDTNADATLEADEFRPKAAGYQVGVPGDDSPMVQRIMGDIDPWDTIAAPVDTDEDGKLTSVELTAFYDKLAGDADLWDLPAMTGGGRRSGAGGPAPVKTGPAVGTVAPDFTLEPPNGDDKVTLSSFRGDQPVALIFGSYT